jgi:hypothetical protein
VESLWNDNNGEEQMDVTREELDDYFRMLDDLNADLQAYLDKLNELYRAHPNIARPFITASDAAEMLGISKRALFEGEPVPHHRIDDDSVRIERIDVVHHWLLHIDSLATALPAHRRIELGRE